MKKPVSQTMTCVREIPGEYVNQGDTYQVIEMGKGKRFNFRNVVTGGQTQMSGWVVRRALAAGDLIKIA